MTTQNQDKPAHLSRPESSLYLDGVDLGQLARQHGTPCYVYSFSLLEENFRRYSLAMGESGSVHYAVKANPSLAILKHLAQLGAGFDIVSAGELQRVIMAGGRPASIVFSGVGKRDDELVAGLTAGIGCFNIESASELQRLAGLAEAAGTIANIALRVNPDVQADTHRHIATGAGEHKFGISQDAIAALVQQAHAMPSVAVRGLAMHIGSQLADLDPIISAAQRLRKLAEQLRGQGVPISHLDLGGGLATADRAPPITTYIAKLRETVGDDFRIAVEPGRSIVADAGVLLMRVTCIKTNGERRFAVVDAGMNDFLRPALYDAEHEILALEEDSAEQPQLYDIVGPVCETADTLARQQRLALREGDLLALLQAGAYGSTMSSHYNSRPRCAEYAVLDGRAHLIRRPETIDDLVQHEVAVQ